MYAMKPDEAFAEAVRRAGSQSAFQRATGMSQQRVSYTLRKHGSCPGEFVLKVEDAFGISRHDSRPDLYPRDGFSLSAATYKTIGPVANDVSCNRGDELQPEGGK